jgi:hypothetical protein
MLLLKMSKNATRSGPPLLSGHAWHWPIPPQIKIGYRVVLALTTLTLLLVVRAKRHYRRARPATRLPA